MVNDSRSLITQVEENNKQYANRNVKRSDSERKLHQITGQPVKRILHEVDNSIRHNLPILQEDVLMAEDIYGTSVPHFQGKIVHHKFQQV